MTNPNVRLADNDEGDSCSVIPTRIILRVVSCVFERVESEGILSGKNEENVRILPPNRLPGGKTKLIKN